MLVWIEARLEDVVGEPRGQCLQAVPNQLERLQLLELREPRSKVEKVVSAFKPWTDTAVLPRCSVAPATKLTFFDAAGKTITTGSYVCFRGTITVAGSRWARFSPRPRHLTE